MPDIMTILDSLHPRPLRKVLRYAQHLGEEAAETFFSDTDRLLFALFFFNHITEDDYYAAAL